jgi:tetratricopeptide (TPR) repeat protein
MKEINMRNEQSNGFDLPDIIGFNQIIELDPNNAEAYKKRGSAYKEAHDLDVASNDAAADRWLKDDYYVRAIADYTEAIRLNPNDSEAYVLRGLLYEIPAVYDRAIADYAIADYTEAIRVGPNNVEAYKRRGIVYHFFKYDDAHAIADFSEAIRLDPNDAWTYTARASAYRDKRDYDQAIADYSEAIRLDPNYAYAFSDLGVTYYWKEDYDRAIADCNEAIRLNPGDFFAERILEAIQNGDNKQCVDTPYDGDFISL